MFRADLHCHTTCSDGTMTPEEVIREAKSRGLSGISITDHDTADAYKSAMECAESEGIEMVTGVEFSSSLFHSGVHILGYGFNPSHPAIVEMCNRQNHRRTERNLMIVEKLNEHGMKMDESDVHAQSSGTTVGRPHIAMAMVEKGYVVSVRDAFNKYLGADRSCYVRCHEIPVQDAIEAIHKANAYAVIAHPMLIKNSTVVKELLKMPFDGIEGYYAKIPSVQEKRWIDMGRQRGWFITGGSDFHGSVKKYINMGDSWVGEETFRLLKDRFDENMATPIIGM